MFKLVVLCAFVAASVAEPEPQFFYNGLVQPYSSYSTVVSPASTSISSSSSSVVHPSPVAYTAAGFFPHLIKKRSPQFLATPYNAYNYGYYPTTSYISPVVHSSAITYSSAGLPLAAPLATHLIKKRSADPQFITPSYYPSTYVSNPAITTPLISSPYLQTPYYSNAAYPLLNTHFIKKRSADPQFLTSYSAYPYGSTYYNTIPTTPYVTSPVVSSTVYSAPATYPLAHLIKKRSADPQIFTVPAASSTYYSGSPYYPTYTPTSTVYKSSPFISTNPFVYSTFIKK